MKNAPYVDCPIRERRMWQVPIYKTSRATDITETEERKRKVEQESIIKKVARPKQSPQAASI